MESAKIVSSNIGDRIRVCDRWVKSENNDLVLEFSKTADLTVETEDVFLRDAPTDARVTELPAGEADGEVLDDSFFDTEGGISVQWVSSDFLRSKDSKEKGVHFKTALPTSTNPSPVLYSDVPSDHLTRAEDALTCAILRAHLSLRN